jgi:hypothetical protein
MENGLGFGGFFSVFGILNLIRNDLVDRAVGWRGEGPLKKIIKWGLWNMPVRI